MALIDVPNIFKKRLEKVFKAEDKNKTSKKEEHLINVIVNTGKVTLEEKRVLKRLKENIRESFQIEVEPGALGKFNLQHIDNLGIDYQIFFMLGKKGIGKTYCMSRYVKEELFKNPDAKFFFIRNTREELRALKAQFSDTNWPFELEDRSLYLKTHAKPTVRKSRRTRKNCGYATFINSGGLDAFKGPDYEKCVAIIWDECNNETDNFKLNPHDFFKFINFCSSVIRDKKNVKILIFGNLLPKSDGGTVNPLMEYLGIPHDSELKIIRCKNQTNKEVSTMIFWNSKDAYRGIEEEDAIGLLNRRVGWEVLYNNMPVPQSAKIISEREWLAFTPERGFCFSHEGKTKVLFTGSLINNFFKPEEKGIEMNPHLMPNTVYNCIKISEFDPNLTFKHKLITDNSIIANSFIGISLVKKKVIGRFIKRVLKMAKRKRLFYVGEGTEKHLIENIDKLESKYCETPKVQMQAVGA